MNKILTDEAKALYNKFMTELQQELRLTTLPSAEQKLTFEDIELQISDFCDFKDEEVISTDTLRSILEKIGTPKQIITALDGENNFTDSVIQSEEQKEGFTRNTFDITASELVKYFRTNHKILIFLYLVNYVMLIWGFIDYGFDDIFFIGLPTLIPMVILFGLESGSIYYITESKALFTNRYLFSKIRPNGIIVIVGTLYLVPFIIYIFILPGYTLFISLPLIFALGFFYLVYLNSFYSNRHYYFASS